MSEGVVTEQPSGKALPGRWAVGMINGPCCIGEYRDLDAARSCGYYYINDLSKVKNIGVSSIFDFDTTVIVV